LDASRRGVFARNRGERIASSLSFCEEIGEPRLPKVLKAGGYPATLQNTPVFGFESAVGTTKTPEGWKRRIPAEGNST